MLARSRKLASCRPRLSLWRTSSRLEDRRMGASPTARLSMVISSRNCQASYYFTANTTRVSGSWLATTLMRFVSMLSSLMTDTNETRVFYLLRPSFETTLPSPRSSSVTSRHLQPTPRLSSTSRRLCTVGLHTFTCSDLKLTFHCSTRFRWQPGPELH